MRNYIILNNQRSDEISGLIIQELAPISKPLQRTQVETIDGRDGDIVTPLGYAAYDKKITIGLYGDFDINEIIAYFATQGTAIFSNEPDKYYNYQILDQIDYERLVRYRVATVTMHVQPFKYSATEGTLTIDASDTVSGEGSEIALDNTAEAPFTTLRHKGNATQTTYSGKNLFDMDAFLTAGGATYTKNGNVFSLTDMGNLYAAPQPLNLTAGETYTFSQVLQTQSSTNVRFDILKNGSIYASCYADQPANLVKKIIADSSTYTIRLNYSTRVYPVLFNSPMLEKSATKTDYEPYVGGTASPNPDYPQDIKLLMGDSTIAIDDGGDNSQEYVIPFGDTYLAGIGDYADEPVKVGDTWYIRRAIGKRVLDGTVAPVNFYNTFTNTIRASFTGTTPSGKPEAESAGICNQLPYDLVWNADREGIYINASVLVLRMSKSVVTTQDELLAHLSEKPLVIYYALATPVNEEITDQDLIDALDELYGQAHSYKGHTHITATAEDGNAPAVLAVEVGEDNESTVTNAGNTTSRPILTIYGQGDIGVYINDVEVLDIALGNEQYITLDSTEMDAYKDSPANLKNRLVAGDYSKLALNAGANKIRFTGNVTKYEISKYSRWL